MHHIGARLTKVEDGFVEIELPFRKELTQQHGLFHGGVVATLADNAAGFAGFSLMSENEEPLSTEFKVNLLSKGMGEKLIARARILKNGRRIKVGQTEVFAVNGEEETLCAVALVSVMAT